MGLTSVERYYNDGRVLNEREPEKDASSDRPTGSLLGRSGEGRGGEEGVGGREREKDRVRERRSPVVIFFLVGLGVFLLLLWEFNAFPPLTAVVVAPQQYRAQQQDHHGSRFSGVVTHAGAGGWARERQQQEEGEEEGSADRVNRVLGIAASSSMWGLPAPTAGLLHKPLEDYPRRLLLGGNRLGNLRGAIPGRNGPVQVKKPGEPVMLNDFNKRPLDSINLDVVREGYLWIPVAVDKFDSSTTDPLVKMCQVNYAKYTQAPWLLPMGGLLSIDSGCAETARDTVQIVKMSVLERALAEGPVPVTKPTGFVFHETRCGSTLVANMIASVETNIMWSESTGPWKLMHTCPTCLKEQIVPWLRIIMSAMSRSSRHTHVFFKFQSSEDMAAVTAAFPDVPWIFIFREPVEVMMSRLGAQRIGMEGMEKEVAMQVEKRITQFTPKGRGKAPVKNMKEINIAKQLAALCFKAIEAFEANPATGMMVEYPRIPNDIVTVVLPQHFHVEVSPFEHEKMMNTTKIYSKVASFAKSKDGSQDSKFTEDTSTKHDAASVAVTEAAQKFLYPSFYKLRNMQALWPEEHPLP